MDSEKEEGAGRVAVQLNSRMSQVDDRDRRFISNNNLKDVITENVNFIFKFEKWSNNQRKRMKEECYHVLGILIYIGAFERLSNLKSCFFLDDSDEFKHDAITDKKLWIKDKSQPEFLQERFRYLFHDYQYDFQAFQFKESRRGESIEVDRQCRLPFEEREKEIGSGAFGNVRTVTIAGGHLSNADGETHIQSKRLALKQLTTTEDLLREKKPQQFLKESLLQHKRVMLHKLSFIHGNTFNILLPLAEYGNLEILLNEGWPLDTSIKKANYDFEDAFPAYHSKDKRKAIGGLLEQMTKIIQAVQFLHSNSSSDQIIIHQDLKPDNILIERQSEDVSAETTENSTMGVWHLTDFGISVLTPDDAEAESVSSRVEERSKRVSLTIRDLVGQIQNGYSMGSQAGTYDKVNRQSAITTDFRRPPGTYTAPEVEDEYHKPGKAGDVWSLGCILAEVLAFAMGGRAFVHDFRKHRALGAKNDWFYRRSDACIERSFLRESEFEFNTRVEEWLSERAAVSEPWVQCCVKVVLHTLVVSINHRPDTEQLHQMMEHVLHQQQSGEELICPECPFAKILQRNKRGLASKSSLAGSEETPSSSMRSEAETPKDFYLPIRKDTESTTFRARLPPNRRDTEPQKDRVPPSGPLRSARSISPSAIKHDIERWTTPSDQSDDSTFRRPIIDWKSENKRSSKANFKTKGKVVKVCICPTGHAAVWLVRDHWNKHHWELYHMSWSQELEGPSKEFTSETFQLGSWNDKYTWHEVTFAHGCAVVRGNHERDDSNKRFRIYKLDGRVTQPLQIGSEEDRDITVVGPGTIAISKLGFVALPANRQLLVFDLRMEALRHSTDPSVCVPKSELEVKPRGTESSGYILSAAAFTARGDRLVAWGHSENQPCIIAVWQMDRDYSSIQSTMDFFEIERSGNGPRRAIILIPITGDGGWVDRCIVREDDLAFFIVNLKKRDRQHSRLFITGESSDFDGVAYGDTHLITGSVSGSRYRLTSYDLRRVSQGKLADKPIGKVAIPKRGVSRMVTDNGGLSVVVASPLEQHITVYPFLAIDRS